MYGWRNAVGIDNRRTRAIMTSRTHANMNTMGVRAVQFRGEALLLTLKFGDVLYSTGARVLPSDLVRFRLLTVCCT